MLWRIRNIANGPPGWMIPAWVDAWTTLKWNASFCQTVRVAPQRKREGCIWTGWMLGVGFGYCTGVVEERDGHRAVLV